MASTDLGDRSMGMTGEHEIFCACTPGLEALLEDEVVATLGRAGVSTPGGVTVQGTLADVYRLNLHLGLALAVRVRVGSFKVTRFDRLVERVAASPWSPWVAPGVPVLIRAQARRSRLYHTGAIVERVRKGLEAHVGAALPALEEDRTEGLLVYARLEDDVCTLSVDTSGAPLCKRGYRLDVGKAPLREDVARALLKVSGWDAASPLVDPLAGSGTLPIEAALLARGLPPGGGRRFAFMVSPGFDATLWARLSAEALAAARPALPFPILGSDRDAGAVPRAAENAARAGVAADVRFERAALGDAPGFSVLAEAGRGAVVTNPPWGRRVGDVRALRPLYQRLAQRCCALPSEVRVAMACGDADLPRTAGLRLRSALLTDMGGVKVRLLVGAGGAGPGGARDLAAM